MRAKVSRSRITNAVLLLALDARIGVAGDDFPLAQITTPAADTQNFAPSISADGKLIAYGSCKLSAGSCYQNIFVYDAGNGTFRQVTNTNDCQNDAPQLSGDGNRIAFRSDCNHTGGNADRNNEIFLFDRGDDSIRQITDTTEFGIFPAVINADGTRIAMPSRQHLTGTGRENNPDLYLFDTVANSFTQLTMPPVCRRTDSPAITADGTRVAFLSSCMLTDRPRSPLKHQYVVDTTTGIISEITIDNTCGSLCNNPPAISGDGKLIAFGSSLHLADPFDGNYELYSYTLDGGTLAPETTTTQCHVRSTVAVNHDASQIAFVSNCDLSGSNSDLSIELFVLDRTADSFVQVTEVESAPPPNGCITESPAISATGANIAFLSSCNLTGSNPAQRTIQVFLAGPGIAPSIPTPTAIAGTTATATVTTPIPTPQPSDCSGDCDGAATVTVDEVIALVNIALGNVEAGACALGVPSGTPVDVVLIIQAVSNALNGCAL